MTNSTEERNSNNIEIVKRFITEHRFRPDLSDTEMFFFNLKFLKETGELHIGDGSDIDHFNLCMTSKYLMRHIGEPGVTNLDGTYKITSYGYPLEVLGNTDIQGVMHPIAFMLTSHEQEKDFDFFYSGVKRLAEKLDLVFNPSYIMQDAWRASYNSAIKAFPGVKVLMCFYHVKANILKNKKKIHDDFYDEFMEDVTKLHMSKSEGDYQKNLSVFEDKYANDLSVMFEYFDNEWIQGVFNNWQIYHKFISILYFKLSTDFSSS